LQSAVEQLESLIKGFVQSNSGIRRKHPICRSDEKRIAEALSQSPQGMAYGWLRQAEAIARRGETAKVPDREEHAKEIQIEMLIRSAHTENSNYEFDFSARRPTSLWGPDWNRKSSVRAVTSHQLTNGKQGNMK
jgi:hypothetical protein